MTAEPPRPLSAKHAEARDALSEELRPAFDALVSDYQFYASVHYASRFVSYLILADLVRAGWRASAPSVFPPLTVETNRATNDQTHSIAPPQELKNND
jgi:hypothetical protein